MARKQSNPQQVMMAGVRQVQCACGCGEHFIATVTPRMREYLNATHKKRAARARAKQARAESTVHLTPKGWLYLHYNNPADLDILWTTFSPEEQLVIKLVCDTGIAPREVQQALESLFGVY